MSVSHVQRPGCLGLAAETRKASWIAKTRFPHEAVSVQDQTQRRKAGRLSVKTLTLQQAVPRR